MKKIIASCLSLTLLAGCYNPNQNSYTENDIGRNAVINFGKVLSVRHVEIKANNSGVGTGIGAVGGGLAGSAIGRGNGSLVGLLAGAVIGGVAGAIAEQSLKDRQGIEYVVRFRELNLTRSIVQNIAKDDTPIAVGQCVMVQQQGSYQRVLPATDAELCDTEDDSTTERVKTVKPKKHKTKYDEDE